MLYPICGNITVPEQAEIKRILDEIRFRGRNAFYGSTDNERINRLIAIYSRKLPINHQPDPIEDTSENRVAVSGYITRAYISPTNCMNFDNDCKRIYSKIIHRYGAKPVQRVDTQGAIDSS